MGAVRVAAQAETGDQTGDVAVLLRLLEHYGAWMGFEGAVEPLSAGEMRRLPTAVGGRNDRPSVEYRLDLRHIARDVQSLTADGTILLDGHPAAVLDGVSIKFRSPHTKPRPPTPRRTRRDA